MSTTNTMSTMSTTSTTNAMKLIGLDLDGTLVDSRDDMVAASVRVRAQLGLPPREDAALRPFVHGGMDQLYRRSFDDYFAPDVATTAAAYVAVREAYEADYLAHVAVRTRLYDGVAEALSALSRLGTLACVTNKPERISRKLLKELGVGDLFATVIGGDTCARAKPDPMMLRAAAEPCRFDPARDRAFMIGDTEGDVQLGRAFGAVTVWCGWGYVAALQAEAPHFVARTPAELPGIVAG